MKNSVKVFLSLGSNMGNRRKYLSDAVSSIEEKIGLILKKSSIYESEAWGNTDQDAFLNQIILIQTSSEARSVLGEIQNIENELGRKRIKHWGARTIDIDILFYNSQVISHKDLIVPHPEIANRMFVLIPLEEIAPNFIHPILQLSVKNLIRACNDSSTVIKFES